MSHFLLELRILNTTPLLTSAFHIHPPPPPTQSLLNQNKVMEGKTFEIGVLKLVLFHKSQLLVHLPKSSFSDVTLQMSHTGSIYVMGIRKCCASEWLHSWALFVEHHERRFREAVPKRDSLLHSVYQGLGMQ